MDDDERTEPRPTPIVRLIGVYDADHTLRGEVGYWIGARLGRRHCALCDITHGSVRERPAWAARRDTLAVPFDTYHRDDQPASVRTATGDRAPAVVAQTADGFVPLLSASDLDAIDGSIDQLVVAIDGAVDAVGLGWPTAESATVDDSYADPDGIR